MENFTIDIDHNGIALVTWDMPNRSMNVLNTSSIAELAAWTEDLSNNDDVKGIVITSGKEAFCAGADLEEMGGQLAGSALKAAAGDEAAKRDAFDMIFELNRVLRALETCGKPVAAAINGTALGGGLEVTLACHYRVAADHPKAQLGLPEAKVGLMPGAGGSQRVPRLIGVANSAPLILEGKALNPQKAAETGIIHKVVPAGEEVADAKRWITEDGDAEAPWDKKGFKIPGGGPYHPAGMQNFVVGNAMLHDKTFGNYPAQKNIMQAVHDGLVVPIDTALRLESKYFMKTLMTPEAMNMVRTLFLSSQELGKGARRPAGVDNTHVKKLGILGAGMMGAGIAYVSAAVGIEVVLIDMSQEGAEKGKSYTTTVMDKKIARGRATEEKKQEILDRITPSTDYALLEGADLVIEAVFEDRDIKADVTAKTEAVIPATSIFASNTSTLPITGLADASQRPDHFIGIHFFSPVDKMPLVEIITGEKTNDKAIAVALDYVRQIKKTPIVVNDSRGFYTSRCFSTYVTEGIIMLAEGVDPVLIENIGKSTGMPVPPLAMSDEVQLELSYHIMKQTKEDLGADFPETPAYPLIEKMVTELGRLGKKNGKGFYDYPEGGKKHLWPGLGALIGKQTAIPQEDIKKRLLFIQALETARCFEENVLMDVRDADVGSIFGWGFAPYTGGTLSFIDTMGAKAFVAECDALAEKYGERFAPNALLRDMAAKGDTFYGRFNPQKAAA